jgi:hypothetical protein
MQPNTPVTVINPDDPFGSPSYEGPANEAHSRLALGLYQTTDPDLGVAVTGNHSFPVALDTASSASRQHYIDTGRYLTLAEAAEPETRS